MPKRIEWTLVEPARPSISPLAIARERRAGSPDATALAAAADLSHGKAARAAAAELAGELRIVHRFALGELEVALVHDGHARRPSDANAVRNASLEEVRATLAEAFQPADAVPSPSTTVGIDAGNGDTGAGGTGLWQADLAAAGPGMSTSRSSALSTVITGTASARRTVCRGSRTRTCSCRRPRGSSEWTTTR